MVEHTWWNFMDQSRGSGTSVPTPFHRLGLAVWLHLGARAAGKSDQLCAP